MKLIKKTEQVQRTFNDAGEAEQRITGATYEIKTNDDRPLGNASVQEYGLSVQINSAEDGVEGNIALLGQMFNQENE